MNTSTRSSTRKLRKTTQLTVLAAALAVAGVALSLPRANAGFSAATDNLTNSFTSDLLAPPSAANGTGGITADLGWTISPDPRAQGHQIHRSNTPGGPYTLVAQLTPRTANTFVDNPADGTYYYVIRAFWSGWRSEFSNEVAITVGPPPPADDYDAIPAASDNCPSTFNVIQLDTDSDGLGDACDPTPTLSTLGTFLNTNQALGNTVSNDVSLADFDGDGDLDAAFANEGANTVWFNDGLGVFTNSAQALGATASRGLDVGDFDGDGDLDITYANNGANTVWFNDGSGTFTNSGQALGSGDGDDANVGDFDGDLDLDIAYNNKGINTVWINDGTGIFIVSPIALDTEETRGATVGDVDGVLGLDLINGNKAKSSVWLNDGTGGFAATGEDLGGADAAGLADFDGDGDDDIVFGSRGNGANAVWFNDGAGLFTDSGQAPGGDSFGLDTGDFDGDGDLDIAFGTDKNENTLWINDGAGTFTDSGQLLEADKTWGVAAGDIDGDGDLDLVYANSLANTVWVNHSPVLPCPADPDLQLCVSFDADAGGSYADASGNANDVLHTNGVLIPGVSGSSITDSPTAKYEVLDSASLDIASAITMEAWLRFDSLPATGRAGVFDNDGQYAFLYYAGEGLRCSTTLTPLPRVAIPVGEWFHAACSWDGATLTMYINGVALASAPSVGTISTANANVMSLMDTSPLFDEPMDGAIDNLRIWSKYRTQAEICADAGLYC